MRRLAVLLLLCASAFVLAACGGAEEVAPTAETVEGTLAEEPEPAPGNAEAGRTVYESAGCGGCHVLEAAGSTGTAGPDLNDSEVDFAAAVRQIENGGNGMPPFQGQLTEEQIRDVAAFVVESRQS